MRTLLCVYGLRDLGTHRQSLSIGNSALRPRETKLLPDRVWRPGETGLKHSWTCLMICTVLQGGRRDRAHLMLCRGSVSWRFCYRLLPGGGESSFRWGRESPAPAGGAAGGLELAGGFTGDSRGCPSDIQSHSTSHLLVGCRWLVERGVSGAEGGCSRPVVGALRTRDFAATRRVWKATIFVTGETLSGLICVVLAGGRRLYSDNSQ